MSSANDIGKGTVFDHADGLMVLPQRDPAVRVELKVSVPTGVEVKHEAMNGAPAPVVDESVRLRERVQRHLVARGEGDPIWNEFRGYENVKSWVNDSPVYTINQYYRGLDGRYMQTASSADAGWRTWMSKPSPTAMPITSVR